MNEECTSHATLLDGLTVPLSESQGYCAKELIEGDVSLGSEVVGEHDGAHHENAVGQQLWMAESSFVETKLLDLNQILPFSVCKSTREESCAMVSATVSP